MYSVSHFGPIHFLQFGIALVTARNVFLHFFNNLVRCGGFGPPQTRMSIVLTVTQVYV